MLEPEVGAIVKESFEFLKNVDGQKSFRHIDDKNRSYPYQTFAAKFEYFAANPGPELHENVKKWANRVAQEVKDLKCDTVIWRTKPYGDIDHQNNGKLKIMDIYMRASFLALGRQMRPNFGASGEMEHAPYPCMYYPTNKYLMAAENSG